MMDIVCSLALAAGVIYIVHLAIPRNKITTYYDRD